MRLAVSLVSGLLLLLLCGWPAGFAHAQDQAREQTQGKAGTTYTVAVVPVVPPSEIKRRWQPVLDRLSRDTGLHFRFRFYKDFQEFENSLIQNEADFAVMSPVQLWRLRQHYQPQLRGNMAMTGIVVVQKDSRIDRLASLQGQTLSLPDGANHAANILVLQTLKEQKITPELRQAKSENNALRSVLLGKADAAIINNYSLKFLPLGMAEQLRIIHQTVELPPPPICANARVPPEDVQRVKVAMLKLKETQPQLLESILMPGLLEADFERDYSIVGKLLPAGAINGRH